MLYQVHFAVELPFWLALPADEYTILLDGATHRVKTSNEVVRIDVGDFYRCPGGYLVKWVHENDREGNRQQFEKEHPHLPVFQRKARTIVTHVRALSVPDDMTVENTYSARAEQWMEESIAVVNRFIECYRIAVVSADSKQEVINVSKWEIESAIVSLWNVSKGMTQISGRTQLLRESPLPPPHPISDTQLETFRKALRDQPPLVASLLDAAASLIPRARWRNAVVDAVTALEVAAAETVRELASKRRVPEEVVDYLAQRVWFKEQCTSVIPALGGPDLPSRKKTLWKRVRQTGEKRNDIVHRGEPANEKDALDAIAACTQAARSLAENP
jgi:hypothetical protein